MLGQRLLNMLGQLLYNRLGQRLYNMLGQRLYNMLGQRLYNMLGQHFLDEQSEDGFALAQPTLAQRKLQLKTQCWPNFHLLSGVSHRVGKTDPNRPRQIIARISNYDARHQLLKSNKTLKSKANDKKEPIPRFANASVSQDLTKERNSAAFECRQIVRAGLAKLTFVWDGKIFVVSNDDIKHKVQNVSDVKELLNTGKLPPKLQTQ